MDTLPHFYPSSSATMWKLYPEYTKLMPVQSTTHSTDHSIVMQLNSTCPMHYINLSILHPELIPQPIPLHIRYLLHAQLSTNE